MKSSCQYSCLDVFFIGLASVSLLGCGDSSGSGGAGTGGSGSSGGEACPFEIHHGLPKKVCPCNTFGSDENYVCTVECTDDPSVCPDGTGCSDGGLGTSMCLEPCGDGCPEGFSCGEDGLFEGYCNPDGGSIG